MDNFIQFKRSLEWDFVSSNIPSDISTEIVGNGSITANDLTNGGALTLLSPTNGDQSKLHLPNFNPSNYDEVRLKILLSTNVINSSKQIVRLGLYSADSQNRLVFKENGECEIRINGTPSASLLSTSYGIGEPTWFEIIWKLEESASFYLNERLIAKEVLTNLPDPSLIYGVTLLNSNVENPSAIEKKIDVYQANLELITYSK